MIELPVKDPCDLCEARAQDWRIIAQYEHVLAVINPWKFESASAASSPGAMWTPCSSCLAASVEPCCGWPGGWHGRSRWPTSRWES